MPNLVTLKIWDVRCTQSLGAIKFWKKNSQDCLNYEEVGFDRFDIIRAARAEMFKSTLNWSQHLFSDDDLPVVCQASKMFSLFLTFPFAINFILFCPLMFSRLLPTDATNGILGRSCDQIGRFFALWQQLICPSRRGHTVCFTSVVYVTKLFWLNLSSLDFPA